MIPFVFTPSSSCLAAASPLNTLNTEDIYSHCGHKMGSGWRERRAARYCQLSSLCLSLQTGNRQNTVSPYQRFDLCD